MLALPRSRPGAVVLRTAAGLLTAAAVVVTLVGCGAASPARQAASCQAALNHELRQVRQGLVNVKPPLACRHLSDPAVRKLVSKLFQQIGKQLQTPAP